MDLKILILTLIYIMIKLTIATSDNPKKKYKAIFTKPDGKKNDPFRC